VSPLIILNIFLDTQHNMAAISKGSSIAIIGAGSVGTAIAYSLLLRPIASSLILIDIDHKLCDAQVQDLSDATFLSNVKIRAGKARDASELVISYSLLSLGKLVRRDENMDVF